MTPIEQARARSYYNPTPYVNNNLAATNLLGNNFSWGAAARNATPYFNPQYQRTPLYPNQQAMIPAVAQTQASEALAPYAAGALALGSYGLSQLGQSGLMRAGTGYTPNAVANMTGYPLALMAAARFGVPAVNMVNRVANSPVGSILGKAANWFY